MCGLLVPTVVLLSVLAIARARTANRGEAELDASTGADGSKQGDDLLVNLGSAREFIRVLHELPQRPASSGEAAEPPDNPAPTSPVRRSICPWGRAKSTPSSTSAPQSGQDAPELSSPTRVAKGARSASDGFDELVLPRP